MKRAILCLALVGCGSSSDAPGKCDELYRDLCDKIATCEVSQGKATMGQFDQLVADCRTAAAAKVDCTKATSVSASVDRCISEIQGSSCDLLLASSGGAPVFPASCKGALVFSGADGGR